ncbi:MAG: hypothetical protein ACODAE_10450, partial [Gemmatimonadota bacterium]
MTAARRRAGAEGAGATDAAAGTVARVLFVPHDADAAEEAAAWAWLSARPEIVAVRTAPERMADALAGHSPHVVWVHAGSPEAAQLEALHGLRDLTAADDGAAEGDVSAAVDRADAGGVGPGASADDDRAPARPGL